MGGLYNSVAWGQQTLAARAMVAKASGRRGGLRSARRRKRKAAKSSAPRRKRRASSGRGRARLVKGSAAAKRYMAKIRRKRRK
jgi:hypothetical protein